MKWFNDSKGCGRRNTHMNTKGHKRATSARASEKQEAVDMDTDEATGTDMDTKKTMDVDTEDSHFEAWPLNHLLDPMQVGGPLDATEPRLIPELCPADNIMAVDNDNIMAVVAASNVGVDGMVSPNNVESLTSHAALQRCCNTTPRKAPTKAHTPSLQACNALYCSPDFKPRIRALELIVAAIRDPNPGSKPGTAGHGR
jgi:hypothetical protein